MPETLGSHLAYSAGYLLLLGALLLSIGGISLISYVLRQRRDEIEHRVAMVEPHSSGHTETVSAALFNRVPLPDIAGGLSVAVRREIMRRAAAFNIPGERAMLAFAILRGISVVLMLLIGFVAGAAIPTLNDRPALAFLLALVFAVVGWFLPVLLVQKMVKTRTEAVADGLPDALELLVVCVEAGLSLEDGIERIVVEMRHSRPALSEELALTAADLKIQPSRDQALGNFADRIDVPSVRSVVTTLAQTMRYGTPLAQALRTVSSEMRNDALLNLEERANRLPTLLTLPMMLFIMPTIFLIVGGPAALRLIDTFMH